MCQKRASHIRNHRWATQKLLLRQKPKFENRPEFCAPNIYIYISSLSIPESAFTTKTKFENRPEFCASNIRNHRRATPNLPLLQNQNLKIGQRPVLQISELIVDPTRICSYDKNQNLKIGQRSALQIQEVIVEQPRICFHDKNANGKKHRSVLKI